ncbi:MAG: TonB-dependent receptor plug domain-containing protein [Saprospiraceae bacterium]|nr:TonB-dependent receptor plug domain-containing protein [Candidatus Vicinibacter affinis]
MCKSFPIFFLSLLQVVLWLNFGTAQNIFRGEITDINEQYLPFSNISWYGTEIFTQADEKGAFAIPFPPDTVHLPFRLIATYAGLRDTFEFDDLHAFWTFKMDATVTLQEVKVYDQRRGAYISALHPIKIEVINRTELRKAACCDLAGCFETQSTVQPQTTNILTNAKELRILGLSGVYNQVLVDGLPTIQGLTYTYGISTLPGSMVENIWVVKGANSVLQGYENMVGQITVFPREGGTAEPFTADLLVNSFNEKHLNTGIALSKNSWSNYLAVHTSQPGNKFDRDKDGFLDLPLLTRYSAYNKLRYRKENENGLSSFVGIRLIDEKRIGGQSAFDLEMDRGSTHNYGQVVQFKQSEIFTKTGYRLNDNQKISLLASRVDHDQQSWFGVVRYQGKQNQQYANLQYELFYGPKKQHDLKAGMSFRYLSAMENISFTSDTVPRSYAGIYTKLEKVPGIFIENIFKSGNEKLTAITGIRADRHNQFGWFVTPRFLAKYQIAKATDLRGSFGTGWRTVNLFSENINLLTSNRDIIFKENIQPEESINFGFSITQNWTLGSLNFLATADYYHTQFKNQFFPDYDTDFSLAVINNFTEASVSNGIQSEVSTEVGAWANFRVAYNYLDVYRNIAGEKQLLPYNAKHRILAVAGFHSRKPLWQVDMNMHWYGKQKLPNTQSSPIEYQQPATSDPFTIVSIQYTHTFKNMEIFGGCENILDFRQLRPIVGYQNPFGKYFDTSFAWGPTRGREFYFGIRFKIAKQEQE